MKQVSKQVELFEYVKQDWTFHAKGIWVSDRESQEPFLTVIGSSNYSDRSYRRDVECNFFIYSECGEFNKKMKEEVDYLFN